VKGGGSGGAEARDARSRRYLRDRPRVTTLGFGKGPDPREEAYAGGADEGGFLGLEVRRRVRFASSLGGVAPVEPELIATLATEAVGGVDSGGGGGGAATGAAAIGIGAGAGLGAAGGGAEGAGAGGAGAAGAGGAWVWAGFGRG
jgi:hypothetical protein